MTAEAAKLSSEPPEHRGYRAAEAYVRPTPIFTHGDIKSYGFDLRNCTFTLNLTASSSTTENAPTEIFLPEYHFPSDGTSVEVSGGKWTISADDGDKGIAQRLRWWHAEGDQTVSIKGVKRRDGAILGADEGEGYLAQLGNCSLM